MLDDRKKDTCPYFLVFEYQPTTNGEGETPLRPAFGNQDLRPMKTGNLYIGKSPNQASRVFAQVKKWVQATYTHRNPIQNVLVFGLGSEQVISVSITQRNHLSAAV